MTTTKKCFLYVVLFSDERLKVGISSDLKKRMKCYRSEAQRNQIDNVFWWAGAAYENKVTALMAERLMCKTYAEFAVRGHREWFHGGSDGYKTLMQTAEHIRALLGSESDSEKDALPYMAKTGHFVGLTQAKKISGSANA